MGEPPVLEMQDIHKEYFGTAVLKGVDLVLRPGEIHALLGENGAGKSTLMNVLFGMPVIHDTGGFEGRVLLGGETVQIDSPEAAMGLGIGMVHQEFMLIPGFRIWENVKLGRERLRGNPLARVLGRSLDLLDVKAMRADCRAALERIHLDVDTEQRVGELPVGHMQFVEIAREVDKGQVRVLVFDEPTAVLTESEAERLLEVMRELAKGGAAILFITHRLDEVMRVADTITILRDGERVHTGPVSGIDAPGIAETMVGREIESLAVAGERRDSRDEPLLRIRGLEVDMPGEQVRGVDLELRPGEILGIGGLAGQGKIGVANGLMGLHPARGEVELRGKDLPLGRPKKVLEAGLAFVSEDRRGVGLLLDESLEMNIAIPSIEVRGRFLRAGFLGPLALVDRRAVRAHALEMIHKLDIRTTGPGQIVRRLSGGNQQKVCLARALLLEPEVLLVSEPTRGIDVGAKQLVLDWLLKLSREEGLAILMTSSELGELRSISDRIAIVAEGRLAGILPPNAPDVKFGLLMSGEAVA
ncbi:MAG: sugar ABC transporter ATP-binding protein [Planctomycetota bacterium]